MNSPIFVWYYQYCIVFTNIRVILPLLHYFHQYSCDATTIALHSPIFVWFYHYYIAFTTIFVWYYHYYIVYTNSRVILPLLHCIHQYSCDATIITLRYCDVPEYTPGFYSDPCCLIFTDVQENVFVSQFCRIYTHYVTGWPVRNVNLWNDNGFCSFDVYVLLFLI